MTAEYTRILTLFYRLCSLHQPRAARQATQAYFLLSGIAMASWAALIPFVKVRLQLDEAGLGTLLLAFGLGAIVMTPWAGQAVSRWGSRRCLGLSGILTALLLPALAAAPTSLWLGTWLFLLGNASGLAGVASNAQGLQVEQAWGRSLMSSFHALFSVGGLVGALLCSGLLMVGVPVLPLIWGIGAGLLVLAGAFYPRLLPAPPARRPVRQARPWKWPSLQLWLMGLMAFCFYLAEGALLDWSAVFLRFSRGFDQAQASWGYAAFAIAMAAGRLSGDRWVLRWGGAKMVRGGALLAGVGFGLLVLGPAPLGSLSGCLLIGLGAANLVPIVIAAAARTPDRAAEQAIAWVVTLGYSGMIAGPALVGFVAQLIGLPLALVGLGGLVALAGLGAGALSRQR
ncbi:MAG: MFS transporter [Candidatus Sericytochromatia bacterium]